MKITCSKDCIFSEYEKERLKSLGVSLQATIKLAEENHQTKLTENEKVELFKLLDSLKELKACTERVIISLCNGDCKQVIWGKEKEPLCMAKAALLFIDKHMPLMKSSVIEFTDGGPGVGVTNKETNFRNAETIRICNIDVFIRNHLANDDSSQNEVE